MEASRGGGNGVSRSSFALFALDGLHVCVTLPPLRARRRVGSPSSTLKGITAASFYDIGKVTLAKAALRFAGIASLVWFAGSTTSEACDLAAY